jgi:hypothetical protein
MYVDDYEYNYYDDKIIKTIIGTTRIDGHFETMYLSEYTPVVDHVIRSVNI